MTTAVGRRLSFVVNEVSFFLSHRLPLALAMQAEGYEVWVLAPESPNKSDLLKVGIRFYPMPMSRQGMNPWHELQTLFALYRSLREINPSLVHLITMKPVLYGGMACRLARIPGVVSALSGLGSVFISGGWRARLRETLVGWGLRLALAHRNQCALFQNPDDLELFVSRGWVKPTRTALIKGSGVDPDQFPLVAEQPGPPTVCFLSRLLKDKGLMEFVAAARRVKPLHPEVRFVLVGSIDSGNPSSASEAELHSWVEEGVVESWGFRQDVAAILARCHLLCLPSYREGVPRVLIEGAATGRAIVTTDTPGCREIVRSGINGILVPVRDSAALSEAMLRLIEDTNLRQAMGCAGRKLFEAEFTIQRVVEQTLQIYRDLEQGNRYNGLKAGAGE